MGTDSGRFRFTECNDWTWPQGGIALVAPVAAITVLQERAKFASERLGLAIMAALQSKGEAASM